MSAPGTAVSVLVPAFRSRRHLVETLRSLDAQTYPCVRVIVSFDHAPGHVLPEPPPMRRARLEITSLPHRLGWLGNTNHLLGLVSTPYFVVLSHDDRLTETYIEAAMDLLADRPEVVSAHGAVRLHGLREGETQSTADIVGDRLTRVNTFVDRGPHAAHLAWRGVHRRGLLDAGLRLRAGRSEGLFAVMLWVLETLLHGATASVEGIYVDRDLRADGLVASWRTRSTAEKAQFVADNIARTAEVLAGARFSHEDTESILRRWAAWVIGLQGDWNVLSDDRVSDGLTVAEARPAIARLLALVALEGANVAWRSVPGTTTDDSGPGRHGRLGSAVRHAARYFRALSGDRSARR